MSQIVILVQILCVVLATAILVYLYANGRRTRATYSYMICIGLSFIWNLAEIFLLMAEKPEQVMGILKVKYFPVVFIGVAWLYFCLSITHSRLADSKAFQLLLLVFPSVCYLFLITNEMHHLFFSDLELLLPKGPIFWIHILESYFCIFTGTVYFLIYMMRKPGRNLKKVIWILLAVVIPITADLLMLCEVLPYQGIDFTSQVMLLTLFLFGLEVYRKRFLNLIPVAARHFIENMSDGIIIIDHENLVVGMNESVNRLLQGLSLKIYDPVCQLSAYIKDKDHGRTGGVLTRVLEDTENPESGKGRLKIEGRSIHMEIRTFPAKSRSFVGKMIILEDRTEEQQLMDEISNKNELLVEKNKQLVRSNNMLTKANQRLAQLSETVEELAVTRERNRMGREVHDTVGHTLTLLIALAENAKVNLNEKQQDIKELLNKSMELSRQALNDIRGSLNGIYEEPFKKANLEEWMNHLAKINASSGVKVDFSISEGLSAMDAERAMTLYRICQESVTNAIRHGGAKQVNITIKRQKNYIRLYIFDDGKGCRNIEKGYGLRGMEERVSKFGGTILFGSDGEKGFNIIAELPIQRSKSSMPLNGLMKE